MFIKILKISALPILVALPAKASNFLPEDYDPDGRNVIHVELKSGMIVDRDTSGVQLTGSFCLSGSLALGVLDLNKDFLGSLKSLSEIRTLSIGNKITKEMIDEEKKRSDEKWDNDFQATVDRLKNSWGNDEESSSDDELSLDSFIKELSDEANYQKGIEFRNNKDYQRAGEIFEELVGSTNDLLAVKAMHNRGMIAYNMKEHQKATYWFVNASQRSKNCLGKAFLPSERNIEKLNALLKK